MSSSQGPPLSSGHGGDAENNDDSLFVNDDDDNSNNNHDDSGEGGLEPQLPDANNDEDDNEGVEGDQNPEPDAEDDSSSEVDPGVLDDLSYSDVERGSKSRSRRRNPNSRPRRCRNCGVITRQWHDEVTRITAEFRIEKRRLKNRIRDLEKQLEGNRIVWDPWGIRLPVLLKEIRRLDPNLVRKDYSGYGGIYYDSCKQGNMSTHINYIHPDLFVDRTAYSGAQIWNHFQSQWLYDRYNGAFDDLRGVHRAYREILFPWRFTRPNTLRYLENEPFKFECLPIAIQCRIWKLLIPNGQLVHCLSRLDPQTPPLDCTNDEVKFPSRFHVDDSPCSIVKADKPSRYLKFLQVSQRWYYATAHLFYATNTFAFSSLGEFGRFCHGIGRARLQRLVHVELMWQGALTPRQPKGVVSLRKQPLASFMYTSRLLTLTVHINESAKLYMRRQYEMTEKSDFYRDFTSDVYNENKLHIFGMESRRTDCQPNYRKTRSMRTVQGMDFIYQLRGMKWVRFYDTNAEHARRKILDWSFLQDINNVVRRKKDDAMALRAEIENLLTLKGLGNFNPDDQLSELIQRFYDETPAEDVSVGGSETSSSSSGISRLSTFTSDSDPSGSSVDSSRGGSSAASRSTIDFDIDRVVEIIDSDTEMEDDDRPSDGSNDNGSQPTFIDISDSMSDSGSPSRSVFSEDNNGVLYESGLHTTVTPQPRVIVKGRKRRPLRRDGGISTDSGRLFVTSGSCTAQTDNALTSDNERPAEVIDLTLEDSDQDTTENRGSADPDLNESVSGRSLKRSGSDDGSG